jgi:hypothetical protein
MRTAQYGEDFEKVRKVIEVMADFEHRINKVIPILNIEGVPGLYEARFMIHPKNASNEVTILESIAEELEEHEIAYNIAFRKSTEVGHGTSWGPVSRASQGWPDLHFMTFSLFSQRGDRR